MHGNNEAHDRIIGSLYRRIQDGVRLSKVRPAVFDLVTLTFKYDELNEATWYAHLHGCPLNPNGNGRMIDHLAGYAKMLSGTPICVAVEMPSGDCHISIAVMRGLGS